MASEREKYAGGNDAATMKPRLIPDYQLLPRDDSGGGDYQPYTAQFGDGGFNSGGAKRHLSVSGGDEDKLEGDEQESTNRARDKGKGGDAPASSRRRALE
jgi:hypothetical protein